MTCRSIAPTSPPSTPARGPSPAGARDDILVRPSTSPSTVAAGANVEIASIGLQRRSRHGARSPRRRASSRLRATRRTPSGTRCTASASRPPISLTLAEILDLADRLPHPLRRAPRRRSPRAHDQRVLLDWVLGLLGMLRIQSGLRRSKKRSHARNRFHSSSPCLRGDGPTPSCCCSPLSLSAVAKSVNQRAPPPRRSAPPSPSRPRRLPCSAARTPFTFS